MEFQETKKVATRDAFGKALVELGKVNKKVVVVSGDLEDATRALHFKKAYPERFFNLGIAEQDLLGVAVGLSLDGLVPFACSFSVFLTNRAYGILRISVCYNRRNVKLIGSHAGLMTGPDGATAQCLEDLAITRVLPNLCVVVPADAYETEKATFEIAKICGPVYLRLCRAPTPIITREDDAFILGKAKIMHKGSDVGIIACGVMVSESLKAARALSKKGIEAEVLNMHTIKPLDEKAIVSLAKKTGAIVVAEEHQINGGLGSAVAEVLAKKYPVPLEFVAVKDKFGQSGEPYELLRAYNLTDKDIVRAAKKVIKRK